MSLVWPSLAHGPEALSFSQKLDPRAPYLSDWLPSWQCNPAPRHDLSPEGLGPPLDVLQSLDPEAQLSDVSLQLSFAQIHSLSKTAERGRQLPQTQKQQVSFTSHQVLTDCVLEGGVLLVHLLAAGGAADRDDCSEAGGCVLHELMLQSTLSAGVRPGESLIQVEETVQRERESDETPAHWTPHLQHTHTHTHTPETPAAHTHTHLRHLQHTHTHTHLRHLQHILLLWKKASKWTSSQDAWTRFDLCWWAKGAQVSLPVASRWLSFCRSDLRLFVLNRVVIL